MFDTIAQNYAVAPPQSAKAANIDPATGKPFAFYGAAADGRSGLNDWIKQGTQLGDQSVGQNGQMDAMGAFSYTPEFLQSIGYTGGNPNQFQGSADSGAMGIDPAFTQFLKDKGLTLGTSLDGPETDQWRRGRAFDAQGNAVGSESRWRPDVNEDAFGLGFLGAAGIVAAPVIAAAYGGAGAGGLGAEGVTAVTPGEFGELGYGASGAGGTTPGVTGFSMGGANGAILSPEQLANLQAMGAQGTGGAGLDSAAAAAVGGQSVPGAGLGAASGAATGPGAGLFGLSIPEAGLGAGGALGAAQGLGQVANTGSDAHLYQQGGPAAGGITSSGNAGQAISDAFNAGNSGSWLDSIGNALKGSSTADWLKLAGGIGQGLIGANAAGNALDAQTKAAQDALKLQKYMYDTARSDWAPYRTAGTSAVGGLTNLLQNPSSITSDPGYQFQLNQGTNAIDRSAANRGGLYSGATLKALDRYGTDYASTKLDDSFRRLANVAQLGATGTSGTVGAGTNYANQGSAITTGLGNAGAAASLYSGNTWQNALNGGIAAWNKSPYGGGP